ncbi:Asp-tRNA(Asn)/Glu-tRNA(Gln) amidotransferase subunit GatC [Flavihumibacter petaseus]|uniref:Aspartyl/glutamyl-tRNA(Asn/Gln) amidotransferase subunit C n=1 Tax=Flavihumibacter petaseus NBRC 106054 TaxID=1220578 RepID=A0A0E9MVZ0_9BACT|nr:Asp-tRNA(Asn)/Glu-tRNA(Gln) amidotransferase subunit GatC [Flavihumibacter petaseus]GAO41295.1 aspartyl/glutamyl-tRNA(Asn/Gln) amidotransferase subunit C [Flavihumibacter petaseus NBRC 106054]
MEVTKELITHLAGLARLEFNEEDTRQIQDDLTRMISFVEKLNQLDTSGVQPLLHMTDQTDVLRADRLEPSLERKTALELAPDADDQYFYVPKVIKK